MSRILLRRLAPAVVLALLAACDDPAGPPTETEPRFASVTAGVGHSCALTTAGQAYCWGANGSGQLGNGTTSENSTVPVAVTGGLTFRSVSAGGPFTCGVTTADEVYCWGLSQAFGAGPANTAVATPTRATEVRLRHVDAAQFSACGTMAAGVAHCWSGLIGPLADVSQGSRLESFTRHQSTIATEPGGGGGRLYQHQCGIDAGAVFCWGDNLFGELGTGTQQAVLTPTRVASSLGFRSVDTGNGHTCAVTTDDRVLCWGRGTNGVLGNGSTAGSATPVEVAGGLRLRQTSTGSLHSCGVTPDGAAYCWGLNNTGQLGNGEAGQMFQTPALVRTAPTPIAGGGRWAQVSAGSTHSCGVTTDGELSCWGWNGNGQLGDGTTMQRATPVRVLLPRI